MSNLNEEAREALQLSRRRTYSLYPARTTFVPYPVGKSCAESTREHARLAQMFKDAEPSARKRNQQRQDGVSPSVHGHACPAKRIPHGEAALIPIIYVQAPPVPDERRFYAALLDAIGMVHRKSQRTDDLFYQVRTLLPKVGLKMIIIDEIHHVLAGSTKRHHAFLNTIKYLANELIPTS